MSIITHVLVRMPFMPIVEEHADDSELDKKSVEHILFMWLHHPFAYE